MEEFTRSVTTSMAYPIDGTGQFSSDSVRCEVSARGQWTETAEGPVDDLVRGPI